MMTLSITRSSISTKKDSYKESKFINWVKACQKDSEEWGKGIIDDQDWHSDMVDEFWRKVNKLDKPGSRISEADPGAGVFRYEKEGNN